MTAQPPLSPDDSSQSAPEIALTHDDAAAGASIKNDAATPDAPAASKPKRRKYTRSAAKRPAPGSPQNGSTSPLPSPAQNEMSGKDAVLDLDPAFEYAGPTAHLTITEIAELAAVSTKTISRYLNNSPLLSPAMRARVEAVIAETGFVPNAQARALALKRNFLLALVHEGTDRGIVEAVGAGMLAAIRNSELALVLQPLDAGSGGRAAALHTFLARHRPSGIVLLPPLSEDDTVAATCQRAGVACVRLGQLRDGDGLCSNDRVAMAGLVSWLVGMGHRRIGLVGGPESSLLAQQRELGYLDAMADHGLDRGPALIEAGDNSFESGIAAGHLLLEISPRPSAIIACNDAMAAGLLHAAGEYRLSVPDDLSVVGFDDTPIAAMTWPALTTMHVPWRAMGIEAVAGLLAQVDPARAPTNDRAFEVRLVERGSVRPLIAAAQPLPVPAQRPTDPSPLG